MYYDSDKSEESEIGEASNVDSEEEQEVTTERMAPPEDRYYNKGGSFVVSFIWLFFELVTLFKDFYELSFKPTFEVITNGYFKTVVSAMYQNDCDVRNYSSLEQFLSDQYLHPKYKFIVYSHETKSGNLSKPQNIILNNGVEVTKSIGEINYRNSKGSIMVLRAYLPGSSTMYDINLKHPHNYMVVGNVVTHYFIAWYLKNNYNITLHGDDLLHTKLEYMNSSYKLDTVTAPYEIKIQENNIVVEGVSDEHDSHKYLGEEEQEEVEYISYEEDLTNNSKEDKTIENSDNDEDYKDHSPSFTIKKEGNTDDNKDTNQLSKEKQESKTSDGVTLMPSTLDNQEAAPAEAEGGSKVKSRREKGAGRKKQEVHVSIPESVSVIEDDKGTVGKREKKLKSKPSARTRSTRKRKDTCTCGVCGRECHISELNEYLLCDECT
jgi:hypothetical protein